MQRFPSNVNLPLELLPLNQMDMHEDKSEALVAGQTSIADILKPMVHSTVADSSWVAHVGPAGVYPPLDRARVAYQLSLFGVLALPIFFWVVSLQKKTRRLEAATSHFGEGDFSTRVSEEGKYRVGQLNRTFNLMAERVERLIIGRKSPVA